LFEGGFEVVDDFLGEDVEISNMILLKNPLFTKIRDDEND